MATVTNENLLAALNQVVQAITEITVGGGGGTTEVNVTPKITVNCNCGCGGGGTTPPQTPGEEGGTPPPGTGTPDPIDDRKCKVATILVQDLIAYTTNASAVGLFGWSLDYSSLVGVINSITSGINYGLLSISMATGGVAMQLANLFFTGGFAPDIPTTLSSRQSDMVCALYNAANVAGARSALIAASGLTGVNQNYLEIVLNNNALNMLFFSSGSSETVINNYTGSVDCGGCVEGCDTLIGPHSASAVQVLTDPDRWGARVSTEDGAEFPEMKNLGCHFGFKDNRVKVHGFNSYGTYFNVQYKVYGGQIYGLYVADINNYVFDQMYSEFSVYQSLTPFTLSFEVDRTQSSQ